MAALMKKLGQKRSFLSLKVLTPEMLKKSCATNPW